MKLGKTEGVRYTPLTQLLYCQMRDEQLKQELLENFRLARKLGETNLQTFLKNRLEAIGYDPNEQIVVLEEGPAVVMVAWSPHRSYERRRNLVLARIGPDATPQPHPNGSCLGVARFMEYTTMDYLKDLIGGIFN